MPSTGRTSSWRRASRPGRASTRPCRRRNTAEAGLEDAEAQVELARDRLGFTELRSSTAGVVTARSAEPGEVVQPGQAIVQLARDDGRDAVFNVPARFLEQQDEDPVIRVALADDRSVVAVGRVREVAAQADPVTRTFQVRVSLQDPPEAMRLGSTVIGTIELLSPAVIAVPASALTQAGPSPAIWIVDPATSTVSLRNVDILRFDSDRVIVSQGLDPDDVVVTGGVQALHPGQRVAPHQGAAGDGRGAEGWRSIPVPVRPRRSPPRGQGRRLASLQADDGDVVMILVVGVGAVFPGAIP